MSPHRNHLHSATHRPPQPLPQAPAALRRFFIALHGSPAQHMAELGLNLEEFLTYLRSETRVLEYQYCHVVELLPLHLRCSHRALFHNAWVYQYNVYHTWLRHRRNMAFLLNDYYWARHLGGPAPAHIRVQAAILENYVATYVPDRDLVAAGWTRTSSEPFFQRIRDVVQHWDVWGGTLDGGNERRWLMDLLRWMYGVFHRFYTPYEPSLFGT